ncbi:MAG: PLP-dependent transferase [Nitrospinae bacterium]|nr:PLP-dependent transferase [Nitrospinota bacterium]
MMPSDMQQMRPESPSQGEQESPSRFNPATAAIHAGYSPSQFAQAVKPPVVRTSTFVFSSAAAGAQSFQRAYHLPGDDGHEPGLVYARLNSPNTAICEAKMVALEAGATHAAAFPSGMSAITTAILALVPFGGRILYTDPVYGGTHFFFNQLCPQRFGIETVPVDTSDLAQLDTILQTQRPFDLVFLETPANPTLSVTDIAAVTERVRRYDGLKTRIAVDNTFLGPVFQQPFRHGADLVVYSATKFLGGHSDVIAGMALTRAADLMRPIRDYRTILGPTIAADTAWLLTRSLETLWLRMQRQADTALQVAAALQTHAHVERVLFPGLLTPGDGAAYATYRHQCSGPGAVLSFYLKDDTRSRAYRFLDALRLCHLAVSLGGTETLIEHPRSMTHSDMPTAELERCGITEAMIRLSVGLESPDDILRDLFQALDATVHAAPAAPRALDHHLVAAVRG